MCAFGFHHVNTFSIFHWWIRINFSTRDDFIRKRSEYGLGEWLLHADGKQNLAFPEVRGVLETFFWAHLPNSAHYLQHVWLHMHQHIQFTSPLCKHTNSTLQTFNPHFYLCIKHTKEQKICGKIMHHH